MQRKFFDHRSRLTADLPVRYGVVCGTSAFAVAAPASGLTAYGPFAASKGYAFCGTRLRLLTVIREAFSRETFEQLLGLLDQRICIVLLAFGSERHPSGPGMFEQGATIAFAPSSHCCK